VQMAEAMSIELAPASPARRLLAPTPTGATVRLSEPDSIAGQESNSTRPREAVDLDLAGSAPTIVAPHRPREEVAQRLSAGIQDITNSMVEDGAKLNDVLRMVLETMLRALHFQRVVFCLRDPKSDMLTGRFGLGDRASEIAAAFKVPLKVAPGAKADLFTAVCLKGADTLISDASVPAIASRLPPWHRGKAGAAAFLLLPMATKGAPFALIYADKAQPEAIELDEKELSLLRTLRNQALMAFRQAA
jgi:eukaryotic-like serine/threonine-protein kinase